MSKIPLRNKKGEIIDYTTVSPEDFEHLNQFKWCKNGSGYVIGNRIYRLHRYIKLQILKETIPENYIVDHIDNDRLNNQRSNLRIITHSENSRNKKKKENCTSKYIGVSLSKKYNSFEVHIRIKDNKRLTAIYNNEIHAAYQYNLWIDEYNLEGATKNDIEFPQDFVKHVSRLTLKELPTGITQTKSGNFKVRITIDKIRKILGTFATLQEAITVRQQAETKRDIMFKERLLAIPKTFNEKNQCIFKIKDIEVIIDEESFYDIIKYKWSMLHGYVYGTPNGKKINLSRYIMNYDGNLYVDHIDNNKLNNCKDNLRLVTPQENAQNRTSHKNSSSQYIGVCFIKDCKKWASQITVNGKTINLGTFTNEIEAAKARDKATLEHFGTIGNLNFPESIL